MKLVITGAGGFLGQEIIRQAHALPQVQSMRLVDITPPPAGEGIEIVTGDLCDPAVRAQALADADAVIHLAAMLGGAAESDPTGARAINVDMTLDMADWLRINRPNARFVFASSVTVLGAPLPDPVTDAAPLAPVMVYGAHKAMVEVALSNYARRGWLDAVSLRPAGIVARDGADAALKSAFMSRVFWCVKRGEDITLPVAEDSRTWIASVSNVAANFLHGAFAPLGGERALTLPTLPVTMGELVAALRRVFPNSPAQITFSPDAEAVALFGSFPAVQTTAAEQAGFLRDTNIDALVRAAITQGDFT
ncbi:MAG: nucleoside-diphosphate-sugar epimerase [Halocynthiibacter sp.]|jgi:nucleoside-diphosphate-sugar epimerase